MKVTVIRSAIIDHPIDRVWAVLRDFNSHGQWHPAVVHSQMENDLVGDVVGGVRRFSLEDGIELREQLLHHSDRDATITYSILDASLPLDDYLATLRLKPVTDGNQTFWHWRAQFRAPDDRAAELENVVSHQVFEAGFNGLRRFLAEPATPSGQVPDKTEAITLLPSNGEHLPSKAVLMTATGGPEVMSLGDVMVPAPGPRQVRIRQTAVAVNDLDLAHRRGTPVGVAPPGIPGMEGVGIIIDMGAQVNGLFPGDRVAYLSRIPGAYTGIRLIDADACIPLPEGTSNVEGSSLLKGFTAGLLLSRVFRAAPGETILIQSVADGVGHLLSQWAKSMDLCVIGTVISAEEARFSRAHGCDHPIVVADDTPPANEVMRITNGRGVDYLVHNSGARGIDDAIACLARCGHLAVIGDRDGQSIPVDVNVLKQGSLTVSAPVCFDYVEDRLYFQRLALRLFAKIQDRTIVPAIRRLPLNQAQAAHHQMEARQTMGAVVLIPGP